MLRPALAHGLVHRPQHWYVPAAFDGQLHPLRLPTGTLDGAGARAPEGFVEADQAGWEFLPFQAYANSIFADNVGQAYTKQTDLLTGLQNWQKAIVGYGNSQGFKVNAS